VSLDNEDAWDEGSPVPLYVISGGGLPTKETRFDLVTLITSKSAPEPGMQPEQAAVLAMCDYPLSVAEISHYLSLPFSVVTVLLSKLAGDGRIQATAPVPVKALPDPGLLEAVIDGLLKL
jgi:hypothetical protein